MKRGKKIRAFALVFLPVCLLLTIVANSENGGAVRNVQAEIEMDVLPRITVKFSKDLYLTKANANNYLYETKIDTEIRTNSKSGYTAFLSTDKIRKDENDEKATSLVHLIDEEKTIPTLSEAVVSADFPANHWGYSIDGENYYGMPAYNDPFDSYFASSDSMENRDFDLYFATKIDENMPNGFYENTIIVTAVANYVNKTINDIQFMQDMNDEIALSMVEGEQYQLKDKRDGKRYWISRLKDGNVWMTQDLDYAPEEGTKILSLTPETTDVRVKTEFTNDVVDNIGNKYATAYSGTNSTSGAYTDATTYYRIWERGDYYFDRGSNGIVPLLGNGSLDDGGHVNANYLASDDAIDNAITHSFVGNIYNMNAAFPEWRYYNINNANRDRDLGDGNYDELRNVIHVNTSICPSKWRMPFRDEYQKVLADYGVTNNNTISQIGADIVAGAPLYLNQSQENNYVAGFYWAPAGDNIIPISFLEFPSGEIRQYNRSALFVVTNFGYDMAIGTTSSTATTFMYGGAVRCVMRWN